LSSQNGLAKVLTTLRHCHLQVENMDLTIIMMNNWHDDMCANCKLNFKQYLKIEKSLEEENYNLIVEHDFCNDCRLMVINFVGLGWFVWGVVGPGTWVVTGQSFS